MIDWTTIFNEFRGKWVAVDAVDETTVVASHRDPERAMELGRKSGRETFLLRVPARLVDFVGYEVRL